MKRILLLITILFIGLQLGFTQEETNKPTISSGNIPEKFDYVINKSNNYQEFKVVKKVWLNQLKKQIVDSFTTKTNTIKGLKNTIESQQKSIRDLQTKVSELNTTISQINTDKANINFIGTDIKKDSFKSIFWGVSGVLTLLLVFFIYKFNNSNSVTKETKALLTDVEKEFEDHRKVALEREQKVMRKLQDEINKNKL